MGRRLLIIVAAGAILIGWGYYLWYAPESSHPPQQPVRFTISPETTILTEPIGEDGYVNYVAAINARASEGVTPENNFAVVFWQVAGVADVAPEHQQNFFQALGMEVPPAEGDYFQSTESFAEDGHLADEANELGLSRYEALHEQLEEALAATWTADELPAVAHWLEAQNEHLDKLIAGLDRSEYYQPLVAVTNQPAINAPLYGAPVRREVAMALSARAMNRIAAGDDAGAWDDITACHQMAMRYRRSRTVLDHLMAVAVDRMAFTAALAWVSHQPRSAEELALRRASLEAIVEPHHWNVVIENSERYFTIEDFRDVAAEVQAGNRNQPSLRVPEENLLMDGDVDWDEMARMVNRQYDELPRLDIEAGYPAFRQAWKQLEGELEAVIREVHSKAGATRDKARDRAMVAMYYLMKLPHWGAMWLSAAVNHQQGELLRLAYAVEHYRAQRGAYPDALAALVPDYLNQITPDRFSDKPLHYARVDGGCELASAGPEGEYNHELLYIWLGEVPESEEQQP